MSLTALNNLIDRAVELAENAGAPRGHLGASAIGGPCERALWYAFRWANPRGNFNGRMLRLFERGKNEEVQFTKYLESAGLTVITHNEDGSQFNFSDSSSGGHFCGSLDGLCCGVPGNEEEWHVVEFKTHSEKSFLNLKRHGVKSAKYTHYCQMQMYMEWAELKKALYCAVNKNNDDLHFEIVDYDCRTVDILRERAERVVNATSPPDRVKDDASYFECKICNFREICYGEKMPEVNCRTCINSIPGDGATWHCSMHEAEIPSDSCEEYDCHRYIPDLIQFAKAVGQSNSSGILYETEDGRRFVNGPDNSLGEYSSKEISVMNKMILGDKAAEEIKRVFDGRFIEEAF